MMDKAYILKNGILEQYLLGELNARDTLSVEQLLDTHKDLKTQLNEIESSFETIALENAIEPPNSVKQNLLKSIKIKQPKVIPLQKKNNFKSYFAIAASIAAILIIGSIWMFSQWNSTKNQLQIAEENYTLLQDDVKNLQYNLKNAKEYLQFLNSTETEQFILNGNHISPNSKVVSYVNHLEKQVLVNTTKLSQLDEEHDYQMWADVEGEMINMGVINTNTLLLAMKYIDNAESLNITIEPKGGSEHPTVSKLISNVYL